MFRCVWIDLVLLNGARGRTRNSNRINLLQGAGDFRQPSIFGAGLGPCLGTKLDYMTNWLKA